MGPPGCTEDGSVGTPAFYRPCPLDSCGLGFLLRSGSGCRHELGLYTDCSVGSWVRNHIELRGANLINRTHTISWAYPALFSWLVSFSNHCLTSFQNHLFSFGLWCLTEERNRVCFLVIPFHKLLTYPLNRTTDLLEQRGVGFEITLWWHTFDSCPNIKQIWRQELLTKSSTRSHLIFFSKLTESRVDFVFHKVTRYSHTLSAQFVKLVLPLIHRIWLWFPHTSDFSEVFFTCWQRFSIFSNVLATSGQSEAGDLWRHT